jgi:hypothetical protein
MKAEHHDQNNSATVASERTIAGDSFTILVLPNLGGISGRQTKKQLVATVLLARLHGCHILKTTIMKITTILALTLALGASTALVQGQPGGPGGPPGGGRFPMPPIIKALDVNGDGTIDSNEIANASAELLTLDKNGDGKLSAEELKPKMDGDFTPPGGGKFPTLPIMKALDTNGDGELDASEIANASTALKTLDKNGDGELTRDEYMPQFHGGRPDGPPPGDQ